METSEQHGSFAPILVDPWLCAGSRKRTSPQLAAPSWMGQLRTKPSSRHTATPFREDVMAKPPARSNSAKSGAAATA